MRLRWLGGTDVLAMGGTIDSSADRCLQWCAGRPSSTKEEERRAHGSEGWGRVRVRCTDILRG